MASTTTPDLGGPVSQAVADELRTWVRRHGIVVWLDADDHYSNLVDRLTDARQAEQLPYDIFAYRGSFLELSMALEHAAGSTTPKPVVIHLPRFNEQNVRKTPMLELYLAGARFRKALSTAVTDAAAGRVRPEDIEAYNRDGVRSLADADAWLADRLSGSGTGLAGVLRPMSLVFLLEDLLSGGTVAHRLQAASDRDLLWAHLAAKSGMPDEWHEQLAAGLTEPTASDIAFVAAAWALCVEYVHDLGRPPHDERLAPAKTLPAKVVTECQQLADHLRQRHPAFYRRTADATEALLEDEFSSPKAEDLGKIDTFRIEEQTVLRAALARLAEEQWDAAATYADDRLDGGSFWLKQDPERNNAWQLIRHTAALGQAIVAAGSKLDAKDLTGALHQYRSHGAAVDRAHRHVEQRREELLYPLLPEYERLRRCLNAIRSVWRRWADAWAIEFNALCRREGFLPDKNLQQRNLFDQTVRPFAAQPGVTAFFVVDALRYEMGEELFRTIESTPAATVRLEARLAELPTETAVGMNVLAPVVNRGRLQPEISDSKKQKFLGFSTGQFRVKDVETRRKAKFERVGGNKCPWLKLEDVVSRDRSSLRSAIGGANLVVVHSEEIDAAGEKGAGPNVFGGVMQKLRAAWRLLHDAGVQRFVITADHGFLLLRGLEEPKQAHGPNKQVPNRRYTISPTAADHDDEARVAMADLAYDGVEGHLMFPQRTVVFDTGNRPMSFVHGGNSLQERVIPVLTIEHKAKAGATTIRYKVTAEAQVGVGGMHCVTGRVDVTAQGNLEFSRAREVELALRVVEPPETTVELCQARRNGRLDQGVLFAQVGEEFELFFRLTGPTEARGMVEVYHPSATEDVEPFQIRERFDLSVVSRPAAVAPEPTPVAPAPAKPSVSKSWLELLPDGAVRQFFEHLDTYDVVTEDQAIAILGSHSKVRRFSVKFDEYVKLVPFRARIENVAGVKRYTKE